MIKVGGDDRKGENVTQINILVAIHVASRGIRVKDIALVINYDFTNNYDDYVPKIGRTGRAGAFGTVITFFYSSQDAKKAGPLVRLFRKSEQEVPAELGALAVRSRGRRGGRRYSPYGSSRGGTR